MFTVGVVQLKSSCCILSEWIIKSCLGRLTLKISQSWITGGSGHSPFLIILFSFLSLSFYGSVPAALTKRRPVFWTRAAHSFWATARLSHRSQGGRARARRMTLDKMHPAAGWASQQAVWSSRTLNGCQTKQSSHFSKSPWLLLTVERIFCHLWLAKATLKNLTLGPKFVEIGIQNPPITMSSTYSVS